MRRYFGFIIALLAVQNNLLAAEAGMPQLDPKYWASQAFWLIFVFTVLYISISKFYLPKIKNNLDDRQNKIKDDLDDANKFKELSETKLKEYEKILDNAKKEVIWNGDKTEGIRNDWYGDNTKILNLGLQISDKRSAFENTVLSLKEKFN